MKTKITSLLTALMATFTLTSCYAQSYSYDKYDRAYDKGVSVEATSSDISYNLDLRAVSSAFADSRNLEEFERRLNDYDEGINNLDLNQDGQVDYLRVIETSKGNSRLVVIQAVLDRDVFQDVASIVLERRWNSRTYVQVIGDPYIYGPYYIIEPVYVYTPSIFSWFWGPHYMAWHSPYYWGYYPSHFHYWGPRPYDVYYTNINIFIGKSRNTFNYSDRIRDTHYNDMRRTVSRTDYERINPNRSFASRNANTRASNTRDLMERSSSNRVSNDNSGRTTSRNNNTTTNRRGADVNSRENANRTENSTYTRGATRNSNEWNSQRQNRTENRATTNNRQDANTSSSSRTSRDYDDVYSRPSRNSSNSGTYTQPSRSSSSSSGTTNSRQERNNSTTRGSSTYSQPSRNSSSSSSQPSRSSSSSSSQPSRSSSSNSGSYSQPSRSSSSSSSQPSRSSSESSSSSSRGSSDNGGGRGGRR